MSLVGKRMSDDDGSCHIDPRRLRTPIVLSPRRIIDFFREAIKNYAEREAGAIPYPDP